jgi:hypothetical protein
VAPGCVMPRNGPAEISGDVLEADFSTQLAEEGLRAIWR